MVAGAELTLKRIVVLLIYSKTEPKKKRAPVGALFVQMIYVILRTNILKYP